MKPNPYRFRIAALTVPSLAALACCLSIAPLHAQLVIHEPFAQASGTLNGKAGGTGLSGNWTVGSGTVNVVTPSTMVFGGLAMTNGHANLVRSGNTNARVVRSTALADAGLLANDTELWFSLVIMKTNGGGNNEWSGFAFGTSHLTSGPGALTLQGGNGLGFRTRDANVTVGTWNGTTTPVVGGSLALTYNVPSLIVGKIKWGATVSDVETITLYKPTPDLSSLGTGVSQTMAAVDQSLFTTISYSLRDVDTMNYDEIRFGATQADVMPVDTVPPTLLSITDNMAGGPIGEDVAAVTYTLTFDKHMDLSTITAADFDNAGSATATVGTVAQVSQTVITVQLLPTTPGTLQLRIPLGSELKSFANLALDTDPAILDDTTITIDGVTTPPGTPSSNRWWDGATVTGVTNGVSAGGAATWDNGTTTNWDRGAGFEAPVAWDNAGGHTAIFGGTTGTGIVTLDGNITLAGLTVNLPTATGSVYSIGNVGEDNTLTFTGTKTVTTTATGTGTNQDVIIRAGISGSPTMNIDGRLANSVDQFSLLPGSGVTQTIGTLNMLNTFASNKRLILGGTSTGNVVDTLAWATTANQLMLTKAGTGSWTINNNILGIGKSGRLYVEQGTMTLGGTSNFLSHKIGVSTVRESTFTASNTASKLVAKGTITIGDNREFFYVQNLGTIAPGPGVATLAVTWNANNTSLASNGAFNMQTGSTYEWDIASSTSTDVINVTTGGSNNGNLILGNMTIKIQDAGVTTPIAAGDQLPVFTYETGAQAVVRNIGTITLDTSALGVGWSGTPTLVDNGTGTIYVTGLSYTSGGDTTPPTLTSIVDDKSGGPVTVNTLITYTVTFDEDIDDASVTAADFDNEGTAAVTIGSIAETTATSGIFTVQVTPTSVGSLKLRIKSDAVIEDTSGNDLVVPVSDDTTITVQTHYQAWAGGAAFGDDANGDGVSNGLAFLLGAANTSANAQDLLPKVDETDGNLVLTFSMRNALNRGDASLNVEHSSDLGLVDAWEAALVPNTSGTVNDVVFAITADGILNDVVATIPVSKAAAGKLFGRVDGNE